MKLLVFLLLCSPAPLFAEENGGVNAPLTQQEVDDAALVEQLSQEASDPPPLPRKEAPFLPSTLASLHTGIGKEWLDSKAGVSEFKGSSNLGGFYAKGVHHSSPSWNWELWAAAHNFQVAEGEETKKYLRLRTRLVGFYQPASSWNRGSIGKTLVGVGFETFKMPVLNSPDDTTSDAQLESRNVVGPYIGVQYSKHFSHETSLGMEFGFVPQVFGSVRKGMSTNGFTYWRHAIAEEIFSVFGIAIRQDSLSFDVKCEGVTICREHGVSTSQLLQGRMGIGHTF